MFHSLGLLVYRIDADIDGGQGCIEVLGEPNVSDKEILRQKVLSLSHSLSLSPPFSFFFLTSCIGIEVALLCPCRSEERVYCLPQS